MLRVEMSKGYVNKLKSPNGIADELIFKPKL